MSRLSECNETLCKCLDQGTAKLPFSPLFSIGPIRVPLPLGLLVGRIRFFVYIFFECFLVSLILYMCLWWQAPRLAIFVVEGQTTKL